MLPSNDAGKEVPVQKPVEVDPPRRSRRRRRSSIPRALTAGSIAAFLGGALWALLIATFSLRLSFIAIGVGFGVGFAVRTFGRGRSEVFGLIAMLLALVGCVIGDTLGGCFLVAESLNVSPLDVFSHLNSRIATAIFHDMFSVKDIVFYLIALFTSFKYAVVAEDI